MCHKRIPDEVISWQEFEKLVELSRANIPPEVRMSTKKPMFTQEGEGDDERALTEVSMNSAGSSLNQLLFSYIFTYLQADRDLEKRGKCC